MEIAVQTGNMDAHIEVDLVALPVSRRGTPYGDITRLLVASIRTFVDEFEERLKRQRIQRAMSETPEFRDMADRFRVVAEGATSVAARDALIEIANEYEQLAVAVEARRVRRSPQ